VTETREIELELRGRSVFVAALESHPVATTLGHNQAAEKESLLLSVVADAHELLEAELADSGEILDSEGRLWVDRGISFACEEWLRSPDDINTVGV
jgi:hypothetical protein